MQFETEGEGFKNFRFEGDSAGSCKLGEIELKGLEVLDRDIEEETTCTPMLTIAGEVEEIGVGGTPTTVTYNEESTPVLESISPRLGTVLGGDTVTITLETTVAI